MPDSSVGAVEVVSALGNIARILNKWVKLQTPALASGTSGGGPLRLASTALPGDLFHVTSRQAVGSRSGSPEIDFVYLWAVNTANAPRDVTIVYGGVPITITLVAHEIRQLLPGAPLLAGKEIRAFASVANAVLLFGWVTQEGGPG